MQLVKLLFLLTMAEWDLNSFYIIVLTAMKTYANKADLTLLLYSDLLAIPVYNWVDVLT